MNPPELPDPLQPTKETTEPAGAALGTPQKSSPGWAGWMRKFLACNPFYLASAALLLYGVYRVSIDPTVFQREVLQLIAEGHSRKEIAEKLVISENTVKGHVSNILSKLHLADRTQVAVYAWQRGIVKRENK